MCAFNECFACYSEYLAIGSFFDVGQNAVLGKVLPLEALLVLLSPMHRPLPTYPVYKVGFLLLFSLKAPRN